MSSSINKYFFGEDVFISYSRRDATDYAHRLSEKLSEMKISSFLDQLESLPGNNIPARVYSGLKRSSLLVVIGSEGATGSIPITKEIQFFKELERPILYIDVGENTMTPVWEKEISGVPMVKTSEVDFQEHRVSDMIKDRVKSILGYRKQRGRLLRTSIIGILFLLFSILLAGYFANNAALASEAFNESQKKQDEINEQNDALVASLELSQSELDRTNQLNEEAQLTNAKMQSEMSDLNTEKNEIEKVLALEKRQMKVLESDLAKSSDSLLQIDEQLVIVKSDLQDANRTLQTMYVEIQTIEDIGEMNREIEGGNLRNVLLRNFEINHGVKNYNTINLNAESHFHFYNNMHINDDYLFYDKEINFADTEEVFFRKHYHPDRIPSLIGGWNKDYTRFFTISNRNELVIFSTDGTRINSIKCPYCFNLNSPEELGVVYKIQSDEMCSLLHIQAENEEFIIDWNGDVILEKSPIGENDSLIASLNIGKWRHDNLYSPLEQVRFQKKDWSLDSEKRKRAEYPSDGPREKIIPGMEGFYELDRIMNDQYIVAKSLDNHFLRFIPTSREDSLLSGFKLKLTDLEGFSYGIIAEDMIEIVEDMVAFSPDGRFLAFAYGSLVTVYDSSSGKEIFREILEHNKRSPKQEKTVNNLVCTSLYFTSSGILRFDQGLDYYQFHEFDPETGMKRVIDGNDLYHDDELNEEWDSHFGDYDIFSRLHNNEVTIDTSGYVLMKDFDGSLKLHNNRVDESIAHRYIELPGQKLFYQDGSDYFYTYDFNPIDYTCTIKGFLIPSKIDHYIENQHTAVNKKLKIEEPN